MNKLYKLFFILFLFPFFSNAQSNFKPGYVVTLKGDTIRGFIDYRVWSANPQSINFKGQLNDNTVQNFTPDGISYFSIINTEQFEKYTGSISTDFTEPNRIGEGKDTSSKIATVFLKVLQKGEQVSLYSYTDDIKTRYFIKDKSDTKARELVYRVYYENGKGVNDNTYLKQLFALGQKYNVFNASFQWDIEHADYNSPDLLKIASQLNGVSNNSTDKQKSGESNFNLFVSTAVSNTAISPQSTYKNAGGKNNSSNFPTVTAGIEFFDNPNTQKLIFRIEFMAYGSHYKSAYVNQNTPYIPINYSFDQLAIAFAPQILYNFYSTPKLKIYAGAGFSLTNYSYSNASFASQDGKTPATAITANNPYDFSHYSTLVMIKAGVQFGKNWGIFADYLTPASLSHDAYFQLNATTLQAGLTYYF